MPSLRIICYTQESPPSTPPVERKEVTPILPPSPSALPKARGHHPTIPLKPKARSQTSSPPLDRKSPKASKKMPPPPPAKPVPENEETETKSAVQDTAPVVIPTPKQRPVPPKRPRPQVSRTASDAPVPAPRPVPVPRKRSEMGLKEGAKSPSKELQEVKEVEEASAEVMDKIPVSEHPSSMTVTADVQQDTELEETEAHVQVQREHKEEERQKVEAEADMEEPQHKVVETPTETGTKQMVPTIAVATNLLREEKDVDNERETCHKKAVESKDIVPQGLPAEEKNHAKKEEGSDNSPKPLQQEHEAETASIQTTELPPAGDEYEPMQTGVTRDQPKISKSPEYEEPEEWNPESSDTPQHPGGVHYDTPSPPRPAITAYDVPKNIPAVEVGNKGSSKVPKPQLSVGTVTSGDEVVSVREKSPSPVTTVSTESELKPFRLERDALGVSRGMYRSLSGNTLASVLLYTC